MASVRRRVLMALCIGTILNCSGQGHSSWLFKRSVYKNTHFGQRACPAKDGRCPCGEDGRPTTIKVNQCPFTTDWGTMCEACVPEEELCARLLNCTRCSDVNPAAICAECPPTRYGDHCQNVLQCTLPELSMYTKSRTIISEARTRRTKHTRKGRRKLLYKLEFYCVEGMVLKGAKTIKCKNTGQWSRPPPRCVFPAECSSVAPPIHGARVTEQTKRYVRYQCDVGYVNASDVTETRVQCENGAWVSAGNEGILKCEPLLQCLDLPDVPEGVRAVAHGSSTSYFQGEQLHFECDSGYKARPNRRRMSSLTCRDGQWQGDLPACEFQGCTKFTVHGGDVTFPKSHSDGQYVDLLSEAHVQCHEGHDLVPQDADYLTCMRTGQWRPAVPRCEKPCGVQTQCAVPTSITVIAVTDKLKVLPGEVLRFVCRKGHYRKLSTPTERICLINGTLTEPETQCIKLSTCNITDLSIPPNLKYCKGRHCTQRGEGTSTKNFDLPDELVHPGMRVEFSCVDKKFYHLRGQKHSLGCQHSGRFDGSIPYCKARCGVRHYPKTARVIGGRRSDVRDWPWQAGLYHILQDYQCGAVFISETWVLTAAHCLIDYETKTFYHSHDLEVIYGSHSVDESKQAKVDQAIPHPQYNNSDLQNDIALLKLRQPVQLSHSVGVACLPCAGQRLDVGQVGVVTGWGSDLTQLREVALSVVLEEECKEHFRNLGFDVGVINNNTFCARSNTTTDDASKGDSGGPFVVHDDKDHWVLHGIVSWGPEDPEPYHQDTDVTQGPPYPSQSPDVQRRWSNLSERKYPRGKEHVIRKREVSHCLGEACVGGFVEVASYVPWIQQTTNTHFCD